MVSTRERIMMAGLERTKGGWNYPVASRELAAMPYRQLLHLRNFSEGMMDLPRLYHAISRESQVELFAWANAEIARRIVKERAVKSLVRFSISDRRPKSLGGVTILAPGDIWRSPAAWSVAAVVQNTSAVPLFVSFNDNPSMRGDARQLVLAPELISEGPLR